MILSLLDRHIGRQILAGTLLVLGVLAALFILIVLVDALPDYGRGKFGLYELLRYVVLSQPRKLYEVFPVAVLIGTLMGLSTLALNSELVVIRAAGVSKLRIIAAALKAGVVLLIIAVAIGEYVVPTTESQAQIGRARALATGFQQQATGIWLRDGDAFVNLGEVLPDLSLLRVSIFDFQPDARLRTHTYAARAMYAGDGWRLRDVRQSRISAERVEVRTARSDVWRSLLTPEVVAVFAVRPESLSIQQLINYIGHLGRNGQETAQYVLALWQKLLMPVATAIMVLLATPFVFRPVRGGGLAQRVFIGVLLGLAFVVLHRSVGYVSLIYGIAPPLAAVAPLGVFLVLALILVARVR